jgi:hypothetical protein
VDINLKRRKLELGVADEIVAELLRNTSATHAGPEIIAHCVATVYERRGSPPSESELSRVYRYVGKKIAALHQRADWLVARMEGI